MSVKYADSAEGWLDHFVGQDVYYAILELGPPDEIKTDGRDGKVYIWETLKTKHEPGYEYTRDKVIADVDSIGVHDKEWERRRRTEFQPPRIIQKIEFIQLFVHDDKTVYHYRHNVKTEQEKKVERRKQWLKNTGWSVASGALIIVLLLGVTGG